MQPVEQTQQQKKKQSPWLYIGIGCGSLLLVVIVGIIFVVGFVVKTGKEIQADMANPVVRTQKVKKMLGAETLPDGYYAVMSISVPAIMELAALSTRPPEAPKNMRKGEERVFMYFFFKSSSTNDQEALREYLEGRSDDADVLERNKIRIGRSTPISRGAFELDGRRVLYLAMRGELSTQGGREGPGLNSLLFIECPGQSVLRMGIWMAPDPSPGAPLEQLELKGTPVDKDAMHDFMSHLNPCQVES